MNESIEIKKIILKIGQEEIQLSPGEAKELQAILNEIFGPKETVLSPIVVERPCYPPCERPYYPCPYCPPYPGWIITCDSQTGTAYCSNTDAAGDPISR